VIHCLLTRRLRPGPRSSDPLHTRGDPAIRSPVLRVHRPPHCLALLCWWPEMDGEEENIGPFRQTSARTRRMASTPNLVRARQLWQPRPGNMGIGLRLTAPAFPFFLLLQAVFPIQFINEDVNSLSFPSINCAEVRIAALETFCLLKRWGQCTLQFYLTSIT